jgi:hypothetical protein
MGISSKHSTSSKSGLKTKPFGASSLNSKAPPSSPKKAKRAKVTTPKSPSKKNKSESQSKDKPAEGNPYTTKALKKTGAFGNASSSSPKSSKNASKVFSTKQSSVTVTKEMKDYVRRLQHAGVVASVETTPRDNDLVAAMIHVAANDSCVGEIVIDADPRFAHVSNSALLDFADGIRTNFYLTSLEIQKVELGNGFLSALAESIQANYTLEYVDLRHNSFTSDAIVEFCLAMKNNKSLRHVDLRSQHETIHSQQEKAVLEALAENSYVQTFRVEFRTKKCQGFLDAILARNKKKDKKLKGRENKITDFLRKQMEEAEKDMQERDKEVEKAPKELDEKDCDYFFELANLAKKYKVDLSTTEDSKPSVPSFSGGGNTNQGSKLSKSLNFPANNMAANGSFLTADFINTYFEEDSKEKSLTFEFTNQFKLFKRFSSDDPARQVIVDKFVDALLSHPRSNEINTLNMANTCIGDDFLSRLCDRCLSENKLKNLHQVNLETNFISGPGFVSLSKCIGNPAVWKYLNAVKVDNQNSPVKTEAEVALARALCVNRTVIRFSLRVRNLRERETINRCVQRNIDFLRQARQLHLKKTGKVVKRARNKMEQLIDSIAANDPSVSGEVSFVGDQLFLALNRTEVLKAATCFRGNEHVTSVKMSLLKLDDEFAKELAKSIENNSTIEKLVLDNNAIGSEGITAIVGSLARNNTITELQLRHQSKPLCTTDEEKLAGLLESNDTLLKLGVDLRSQRASNELDRKIRQNQDHRRKARTTNKGFATSSKSMIKSNVIEALFKLVIENDSNVTEVVIEKNSEFVQMGSSQKKEFLKGLEKNTNVKRLVLDDVELDNGFADDLASTLKSNKTIQSVSVNRNAFTSPGVLTIAKAATKNKRIRSLSILKPRFKITDEDAEIFLKAMEKRSSLQRLDMEFRDKSYPERAAKVLSRNK